MDVFMIQFQPTRWRNRVAVESIIPRYPG